jgi:signal transduction histidine kinase
MLLLYLFGTFLITAFAITIVVLIVVQKQRQVKARLEKQQLAHDYETSLLRMNIEVHEQVLTEISEEIHDGIGQVLSVSQLQLAGLRSYVSSPEGQEILREGLSHLRQSMADLRSLSHSLHADLVTSQRLDDSLRAELARIRTIVPDTTLEVSGTAVQLSSTIVLPVFRIAQEALQNILKHAKATAVSVSLQFGTDNLRLTVVDNGVGIAPADGHSTRPSLGISNMKRRASVLKGELAIHHTHPSGTVVELVIPLPSA